MRVAILMLLGVPLVPQTPPPMFSPWYVEATRGILSLEDSDAAHLERTLAANPDDARARLQLMAYHQRADRTVHPEDRAKRFQLTVWLIEHHPDSEILHSPVSRFTRGEITPSELQRTIALWSAALRAQPRSAAVAFNASSFFEPLDGSLYLTYLERTAAADPNHPFALRPLAHLYALLILGNGPLARRAQAGLDASSNVWVLGNAAYMFQSQYNLSVQASSPNRRAAELAERYFLRAKALDPKLDRATILPQLTAARPPVPPPPPAPAPTRYLSAADFPALPPAVARVLRARHCRVPQPYGATKPLNVARGEFFSKGEPGWAVLCASDSTSLLAFRNDRDANPETVITSPGATHVQDGGYSREITPVGRDYIVQHYRAYGGPEPPPIDHHGIDDAFIGKASVIWYFYRGKWFRLQGAD